MCSPACSRTSGICHRVLKNRWKKIQSSKPWVQKQIWKGAGMFILTHLFHKKRHRWAGNIKHMLLENMFTWILSSYSVCHREGWNNNKIFIPTHFYIRLQLNIINITMCRVLTFNKKLKQIRKCILCSKHAHFSVVPCVHDPHSVLWLNLWRTPIYLVLAWTVFNF